MLARNSGGNFLTPLRFFVLTVNLVKIRVRDGLRVKVVNGDLDFFGCLLNALDNFSIPFEANGIVTVGVEDWQVLFQLQNLLAGGSRKRVYFGSLIPFIAHVRVAKIGWP